jgi:hypothetical protein
MVSGQGYQDRPGNEKTGHGGRFVLGDLVEAAGRCVSVYTLIDRCEATPLMNGLSIHRSALRWE